MENNTPQKKQLPAFLILTIIAVVAAVVLALTNAVTEGPILEHKMAALKDAFNAVMPAESYEEMTVPAGYDVASLYQAKNGSDVVGYCVTASSMGYAGDVAVTLGVDAQGVVVMDYGDFSVTLQHSKVSDSVLASEIQGEAGSLVIEKLSECQKVCFVPRGSQMQDLTQPQHINTMLYEAELFATLVDEHLVDHPGLAVSRITAKLLTEIRRQTGVIFPADSVKL